MKTLDNDCFLKALLRQPTPRTPIWMMRQAGRYLPEYRAVRERAGSFMQLCTTPELACEVTLQPLQRFRLDAAILFSDILTIPDAMGLGLEFVEGEGPRFRHPLRRPADIEALPIPDPHDSLGYVMEAVRLIRHSLAGRMPLIGFTGSPWTLACYMVEGGSSRDFRRIKGLMYEQPARLHQLLSTLTEAVALYLLAQIEAGVDAIMVFDTWGGVLSAWQYRDFSLAYAARVLERVRALHTAETAPAILFTKGGGQWLEAMADSGYQGLGIDWTTDIGTARQRVGQRVALQGNLDPMALYASPESIDAEVARILEGYGHGSGHLFNLGHGILPDVKPEHAEALIEAVHARSPAYHAA
ncbi:uroporphyrinogen decarboxylase [Candidatus Woesearchaeota archaeon]|jgi:uroporphyrinogen decarboxylase|nr:uroporphyrinogen decarboxylase [Candidatus Woesearchaeota archaeon]